MVKQSRNYSAIRLKIKHRDPKFLSRKEREDLMTNLNKGMNGFVLEQKRKENAARRHFEGLIIG